MPYNRALYIGPVCNLNIAANSTVQEHPIEADVVRHVMQKQVGVGGYNKLGLLREVGCLLMGAYCCQ